MTNPPNAPGPAGGLLQPMARNAVRYAAAATLGALGAYLAGKGVLPVEAVTPDAIQDLLSEPTAQALLGVVATWAAVKVEQLWLRARKDGGPT